MAIEKKGALSLFPTLDQDSQKILLFLLSLDKKGGEVYIVELLEKCMFTDLMGKFHKEEIDLFFEKKINFLLELKAGKEKVFDLIKFDYPKIIFSFEELFYQRSL